MDTVATIDIHSTRARKARLGKKFTDGVIAMLMGMAAAMLLIGLCVLIVGAPWAWLLIGFSVVPCMIALWARLDLRNVQPSAGGGIDQRLESSVLAGLVAPVTPQTIARAAASSISGRFVLARLDIPQQILVDASDDTPEAADVVWQAAEVYRNGLGSTTLSGSMLVAALCVTQPHIKALLPHIRLSEEDMGQAVEWFDHIEQVIEQSKQPKRTGGIARDWNFGYANLLERYGINISQRIASGGMLHVKLDSHVGILQQLQSIFGSQGRQNVALVGKLGVGKTTTIQAFAESLLDGGGQLPASLKFSQIIQLDAGAIIRACRTRSDLETLLQRLLVEAYHAKNIILFLDDAQLFFEEGNGSVDLRSILMPILDAGRLRLILAMDEQAYLRIAQRDPALSSTLNRINVAAASESEAMAVMQDQVIYIESEHNVTFSYQSLREAYRLSERYQTDVAQPGRSVRLLEQAARHAEQGYVTAASVTTCVEQISGVKVATVSDSPAEKDMLLHLEDLIHGRMVNQTHAVSVVSDAIRRARAGVRNEKRPIGTFLFLGPTGVGKTELAKSLADVYFGGEDHMIRLDLNEYSRPEDVTRLIADGADNPFSLTAQVIKQPFSVVLLDEIEKAHNQVLSTLLQMLDEGIMRDINNREVSFRDVILIATSNAGAEKIRQYIDEGQSVEQFEGRFVDELIDSHSFLPEFLNRFDEIVVFRPLNESELQQVVERLIAEVNKTLAQQKVQVTVSPAAIRKLAAAGYDPRLGARPMRRAVQRSIENVVAKRLLEGTAQPGATIALDEADIQV